MKRSAYISNWEKPSYSRPVKFGQMWIKDKNGAKGFVSQHDPSRVVLSDALSSNYWYLTHSELFKDWELINE